jgi:hypothetical protein
MSTIKADAVTQSLRRNDTQRLEIIVRDNTGVASTLDLSAASAEELMRVLADFCTGEKARAAGMTKRPEDFSIGTATNDHAVLIRFESDVPYAISPGKAKELASALLSAASEFARVPVRRHN